MNIVKRTTAGVGALALALILGLGGAQSAVAEESVPPTIEVCNGETISTTDASGASLSEADLVVAVRTLNSYCEYTERPQARGTTYGVYVRNATNATRSGSSQSWTIKVSAVFVPAGALNLNVIYRVEPGTGVWQYGPSLPTNNLPLVSGTMALGKTIQSYGTLAINGNVVEDICNSAGAA